MTKNSSKASSPRPRVMEPNPLDILCGKDRNCVNHEGSKRFRDIIDGYRHRYSLATTKYQKMVITKEIYENICHQGIRFLKYSDDHEAWDELTPAMARDKCGHALRFANRTSRGSQAAGGIRRKDSNGSTSASQTGSSNGSSSARSVGSSNHNLETTPSRCPTSASSCSSSRPDSPAPVMPARAVSTTEDSFQDRSRSVATAPATNPRQLPVVYGHDWRSYGTELQSVNSDDVGDISAVGSQEETDNGHNNPSPWAVPPPQQQITQQEMQRHSLSGGGKQSPLPWNTNSNCEPLSISYHYYPPANGHMNLNDSLFAMSGFNAGPPMDHFAPPVDTPQKLFHQTQPAHSLPSDRNYNHAYDSGAFLQHHHQHHAQQRQQQPPLPRINNTGREDLYNHNTSTAPIGVSTTAETVTAKDHPLWSLLQVPVEDWDTSLGIPSSAAAETAPVS